MVVIFYSKKGEGVGFVKKSDRRRKGGTIGRNRWEVTVGKRSVDLLLK